jgi:hypothetical protein
MKKRMGVLIFLFLTGMMLGTMQPTMLYAGEAAGNPWDQLPDLGPYQPIKWVGPLSIYYGIIYDEYNVPIDCGGELGYAANMYYTVRLNKESDTGPNFTLYTFHGANGTCLNDWTGQADEIRNFLRTVVVPGISPKTGKFWKVESVTKGSYNDEPLISRGFVVDIKIAVKK